MFIQLVTAWLASIYSYVQDLQSQHWLLLQEVESYILRNSVL